MGTRITPNHLTTLRLITGLAACALVAVGKHESALWAGWLWLVSAFLDRADGELARIGGLTSEAGHRYDYVVDMVVNSFLFAGAGIGVRHGWLGLWAVPLGFICTASMLVCWASGESYQQLEGTGQKTFASRWGFDSDDALYLIAPLIWFNLTSFVVAGAAIVTPIMAVIIIMKLQRLRSS